MPVSLSLLPALPFLHHNRDSLQSSYLKVFYEYKETDKAINIYEEILNNEIKITYDNKNYEGHYQLTPYSFRPKVAVKLTPKTHHDLGQGILDCIYNEYEKLVKKGVKTKFNKFS